MKLNFIFAVAIFCLSCNDAAKSTEPAAATEDKPVVKEIPAINMNGYTPSYSNSFEAGDPKHAEAVMVLYKDWDEGKVDAHRELFGDSVEISLGDGTEMAGPRDSMMAAMITGRNNYSMVKSTVHSILTTKSIDKGDNWVCVWAKEVHTLKATGKTDSIELQESYRFNKDGKITWMLQYDKPAVPPTAKK